jgi:replicative DNA helicase
MSSKRVLPHNVDAEASVLGGILLRNDVLSRLDTLEEDDFYDPRHKAVMAAIRLLETQARPIDEVTLEDALQKAGKLEAIGGLAFLADLAMKVPTADNVMHYAQIIQEKHAARRLVLAASEVVARGYEDYGEVADYLDDAESKIFEATQRKQRSGPEPIKALIKSVFRSLDARYAAPDGITGVPTGFAELDNRTAGLQPTELVILAARPAMGKTSFAMSIAQNAADPEIGGGWPVLVFSLEMSATQLAERMLCSEARVDSINLRRGKLERQDMTNLTYAAGKLSKAPILIDDTPALSLRELRARARRFVADKELFGAHAFGLIIVDYLQLMRGSQQNRNGSREQEISEISRGLKALSKELRCPVMALSQLNRGLESRQDKRPMLSDLRESGAIEQDADVILFIYRDVVYNENTDEPNVAEVILGKNRHGATGTVKTMFEGRYTRFENLSVRDDGPPY